MLYEDWMKGQWDEDDPPRAIIFSDGQRVYYDPRVSVQLYDMKRMVRHDRDGKFIFSGYTGVGKSTLMTQFAKLLDPNFGIKNVVFNSKDLLRASEELPKFSVIAYDESGEMASSDKSRQKAATNLVEFLRMCRSRNQFFLFCIPNFLKINSEIATNLSDVLIEVKEKLNTNYVRSDTRSDKLVRGFYDMYDKRKKDEIFDKAGNKRSRPIYALKVRATIEDLQYFGKMTIDHDLYSAKKEEAQLLIRKRIEEESKPPEVIRDEKVNAIRRAEQLKVALYFRDKGWTLEEIGQIWGKGLQYADKLIGSVPAQRELEEQIKRVKLLADI